MKLFFHDLGAEGDFERPASHLAEWYRNSVIQLEAAPRSGATDEALDAALDLGVRVMRAIAEFWEARTENSTVDRHTPTEAH